VSSASRDADLRETKQCNGLIPPSNNLSFLPALSTMDSTSPPANLESGSCAESSGDPVNTIYLSSVSPESESKPDNTKSTGTSYAVSSQETQPETPPAPPPNGGTTAWVQCFDVFLLWFASWGLVNSFGTLPDYYASIEMLTSYVGVFQAYYTTTFLQGISASRVSWIGSLQLCAFILGSVIVGPLYDTGHLRILLCLGTFLIVLGITLTSVQSTYAGILLTQGLCTGIGMTCTFIPLVSVLPPYFSSRRSLAMGLAATGSSIGRSLCESPHTYLVVI